jgi:hypothetical protein
MGTEVFFGAAEVSVSERDGLARVGVVRTGDVTGRVEVTFELTAATDAPATAGADFGGPMRGVAVFEPGETRVSIDVPIVNDALAEPTETFVVSLTGVSGGVLLAPRTARVNILDDEQPVQQEPSPPLSSRYAVTEVTLIEGLEQPLRLRYSPVDAGVVAIVEKGGQVELYALADGAAVGRLLDISGKVNATADRGLMDIAFHPSLVDNPYLYAFYVVDPPDTAGRTGNAGPDGGGNRFAYVSRFTLDADSGYHKVVPGSEVVLVGGAGKLLADISGGGAVDSTVPATADPTSPSYTAPSDIVPATGVARQDYIKVDSLSHAGGALAFGPDGKLYVSIGDGTSFNVTDPRTVTVQNLDALAGKVLRIDPLTGDGLADNPFHRPGDDLDSNRSKVFQVGLRNPFSMTFDDDGRIVTTETGWNTWEEINVGGAGANFGWPFFEGGDGGVSRRSPYQTLPEAADFYRDVDSGAIVVTAPFRAFGHADSAPGFQMQAITGGSAIIDGGGYPASLQNNFIFTDFQQGEIYIIDVNDRRDVEFLYRSAAPFGPVDFSIAPNGAIYYADIVSGKVGKLEIIEKPAPTTIGFTARGAATFDAATGAGVLTPAQSYRTGLLVSAERIDFSRSATFDFDLRFGSAESGGDGIAFFIHADPRGVEAIGAGGGGFGIQGVANGIGIEFDTFSNGAAAGDPVADHTQFFDTDGSFRSTAVTLPNLENNIWRNVEVRWDPASGVLAYSIDGRQVGALRVDLADAFLGGADSAFFGFGAGTGRAVNRHDVRVNAVRATVADRPDAPPTVISAEAADVTTPGGATITVTVTFADDRALDASSFGRDDILVTGPGGPLAIVSAAVSPAGDGSPRSVVYTVAAPGGAWDLSDNGAYEVALRAGQVFDVAGQAVAAGRLTGFAARLPDGGPGAFRVEVEDFVLLRNASVETNGAASDGATLRAVRAGTEAAARFVFDGPSAVWDLDLGYFDETDGASRLRLFVDGVVIDDFRWTSTAGGIGPSAESRAVRSIDGVRLDRGDVIELRGVADRGEFLRVDYLDFTRPNGGPASFRVEAESFARLRNASIEANDAASGGAALRAIKAGTETAARVVFDGQSGVWDLDLRYFDETDGASRLRLFVDGVVVDDFRWTSTTGAIGPSAESRATRSIDGVRLDDGDVIELRGVADRGELLRIDYIDFAWSGGSV